LIARNPFGPNTDVADPNVDSPSLALEMCPCGYFIHVHHPKSEQLIKESGGLEGFTFDRSYSKTVIAICSEHKTHFIAVLFDANKPIAPSSPCTIHCYPKLDNTYERFIHLVKGEVASWEPPPPIRWSEPKQAECKRIIEPSYPKIGKYKTWLKKKVTVEEAEAEHMESIRPGSDPIPFGFAVNGWRLLVREMKPGDEIWEFSAPALAIPGVNGPSGFVLIRGEQTVRWLTLAGDWSFFSP
jgi:hypothetical protein